MNTEPLLQVKAEILADPASLDMDEYFSACGTRMCIAGRLAHNAGWRSVALGNRGKWMEHDSIRGIVLTVEQVASEIMGVSERDAAALFHLVGWPMPLRIAFEYGDAAAKAAVAGLRIDDFISLMQKKEALEQEITWDPCFHIPQLKELESEKVAPVEENETCAVV